MCVRFFCLVLRKNEKEIKTQLGIDMYKSIDRKKERHIVQFKDK